jgi:hypothetical protein
LLGIGSPAPMPTFTFGCVWHGWAPAVHALHSTAV